MSTDKENAENGAMEVEETSNDETTDTKPISNADASEESPKSKEKDTKKKVKGKEVKREVKAGNATPVKEGKTGKVKDEKSESEEEDEEEDDDDDDDKEEDNETGGDGKVPLLDQPLELSGTRERKKVTRFTEEYKTEPKDTGVLEIPEGKGAQFGNIPRIDSNIQKSKPDALKPLHRLLFNRAGKAHSLKRNLRKFNGFDFDEDSDQYTKKKQAILKLETKVVRQLCSLLDMKKSLKREELNDALLSFLMKPEDSGKGVSKPRPKRTARTNNKSYSESDDEEKEERKSSRRGKKKRVNLKEVSSDDDDEEFDDEKDDKEDKKDGEDEDNASDKVKRKEKKDTKGNDSDKDAKENDAEDDEDEDDDAKDDEDDEDEGSSDDSEETKSKSKKGSRSGKNNKAPKKTPKKATPKRAEKKPATKKRTKSDDESSEDEPLAKKSKAPPTDEEIKSYVKEILEGANLEETTMKIVCKQVYAHYPDFDLAHKKDFIKTTVKSLIST